MALMMRRAAMDLYAGCGGMSLGMKNAGFDIVYANEINPDAASTYKRNFPSVHIDVEDIRNIEPETVSKKIKLKRIDMIAAGPPCQGFSTLVKRNGRDPRNRSFKNLVRFVEYFQPKIFVMENVSGILSMGHGRTITKIKNEFEKLSYNVYIETLLASRFGVPQDRKRVFLVGTKKKIPKEELYPKLNGHSSVSVKEAISDLAFLGIGEAAYKYRCRPRSGYQLNMRGTKKRLYNHESSKHSKEIQKRFARIRIGTHGRNNGHFDSRKRDCYKFHPSFPSLTITTLPEDFVHYSVSRIPTVRELARLQSFPDNFVFEGPRTTGGDRRKASCPQYTQVGNAVPPLLAEEVFKNLRKVLARYYN